MKPREQGGVVDERLNVYGVQNLKVAGKLFLLLILEELDTYTTLLQTAVSHQAT